MAASLSTPLSGTIQSRGHARIDRCLCAWCSQEEVPPAEAYEHSEMILYRALILEEGAQFEEAFSYLEASKVCSTLFWTHYDCYIKHIPSHGKSCCVSENTPIGVVVILLKGVHATPEQCPATCAMSREWVAFLGRHQGQAGTAGAAGEVAVADTLSHC